MHSPVIRPGTCFENSIVWTPRRSQFLGRTEHENAHTTPVHDQKCRPSSSFAVGLAQHSSRLVRGLKPPSSRPVTHASMRLDIRNPPVDLCTDNGLCRASE